MLNINTIDSYIQSLRGYNYRIAPLIVEIAQIKSVDQQLMRLSQNAEKKREEAISLAARLQKARDQIQNGDTRTAADMDLRIEQQLRKYNVQKSMITSAASRNFFPILGCLLCVGIGIFGVLVIVVMNSPSDAWKAWVCGGAILIAGLAGLLPLLDKVSEVRKRVKDKQLKAQQLWQEYESLCTQKDEMLRSEDKMERELTALEQDYKRFLTRGLNL